MNINRAKIQSFSIENIFLDLDEIESDEILQSIESTVGFGYDDSLDERNDVLIFFSIELQVTERTETDDVIREINIKVLFQGTIDRLAEEVIFDSYKEAIQKTCDYIKNSINLGEIGDDDIDFSSFLEKIDDERASKKFLGNK